MRLRLLFQNRILHTAVLATVVAFLSTAGPSQAQTSTTPLTIVTSSLPVGMAGVAYSYQLNATGGTAPYRWSAVNALPFGLTLDASTGILNGTPNATGKVNITVQVTDSLQVSASKLLSLVVNAQPLAIATVPPLFTGTVQVAYSQTFAATGGVPPYRWSITSGSAGGLTLNATTGTLQGVPQTSGAFTFTVQVVDSTGAIASKSYSLTVAGPSLTILTGSPLPNAMVQTAYSQQLSVVGGTAPYTWSLTSGSLPGIGLASATGLLTGTPDTPGTYTVTIGVKDSTGVSGTKVFTLTVDAATLKITTANQLPGGMVGTAISQTMTAVGGVPPYTWSANGLPDGLTIDASTGVISGKPTASGNLSFTVRVTDSVRNTWVDLFRITLTLPALPSIQLTGLPGTVGPAEQHTIGLALSSAFSAPLSGQLILSFAPDSGGGDGTIQFSTGGTTASFTIPTGSTAAVFSTSSLAVQTGTVAGSLIVSVRLQSSNTDVTPSPAPSLTTRVERAAPVITSTVVNRTGSGFEIQITGYCTAREVTQATFQFTATSGKTLQTSQFTIPLTDLFAKWFADASSTAFGSQFTYVQPFTVQGDATAVVPQSVVLTNRTGSSQTTTLQP